MVLESANCTECRSEIWHDDNYCQECGVRTSMFSQRDTQWRKAPSGPSWSREDREPIAPSWKKPESWTKPVDTSWSQPTEPTPIRSFVQSATEQSISSQSLPVQPAVPTNTTPLAPVAPKVEPKPEPKLEPKPESKPEPKIEIVVPPVSVSPPAPPTIVPPVKPVASIETETKQVEPVVTKPEAKAPIESNLTAQGVDSEKIEEDVDDSILKARWTALESPLLRPRLSDDVQSRRSPEEVVHKIKITNILWLCVCFLAGILIYCLFDIVKMTLLKPETNSTKQTVVVPQAPQESKSVLAEPVETNSTPAPVAEPITETKLPESIPAPAPASTPAKTVVPVKSVSVHPTSVVPVAKPAKPVSTLAPSKVQSKPVAKAVFAKPAIAKPAIAKPKPAQPTVAPESVLPKSTSDASNARARTVWQASSTAIKAMPAAAAPAKPSHVVTSKGNGTDLTRYNRLLADYFSRAGNGSFGDESSEPPTYTEWLGRGKPEF